MTEEFDSEKETSNEFFEDDVSLGTDILEKIKHVSFKYNLKKVLLVDAIIIAVVVIGGILFINSPQSEAIKNYILETDTNYELTETDNQNAVTVEDKEEMTRKHKLYEDKIDAR